MGEIFMASVFDSVRTVITSRFAFLKVLLLSGILSYPLYQVLFVKFDGWFSVLPILTIIFLVYNLGFIIEIVHNEVTDSMILIPPLFKPLQFVSEGVGLLLSTAPVIALMGFSGYSLYNIGMMKDMPQPFVITVIVLVELILLAITEIQTIIFAHKFNPFFAYNFVKVFKNMADFLFRTINLIFCMIIVSVATVSVGILMTKIFSVNSFAFTYYIVFVIFFYLMIGLYYLGQVYMENMYVNLNIDYDDDAGKIVDKDIEN